MGPSKFAAVVAATTTIQRAYRRYKKRKLEGRLKTTVVKILLRFNLQHFIFDKM